MKTVPMHHNGKIVKQVSLTESEFQEFAVKLFTELKSDNVVNSASALIKDIEAFNAPVIDSPLNKSRLKFLEGEL